MEDEVAIGRWVSALLSTEIQYCLGGRSRACGQCIFLTFLAVVDEETAGRRVSALLSTEIQYCLGGTGRHAHAPRVITCIVRVDLMQMNRNMSVTAIAFQTSVRYSHNFWPLGSQSPPGPSAQAVSLGRRTGGTTQR